jgi:hypothetical protein
MENNKEIVESVKFKCMDCKHFHQITYSIGQGSETMYCLKNPTMYLKKFEYIVDCNQFEAKGSRTKLND